MKALVVQIEVFERLLYKCAQVGDVRYCRAVIPRGLKHYGAGVDRCDTGAKFKNGPRVDPWSAADIECSGSGTHRGSREKAADYGRFNIVIK